MRSVPVSRKHISEKTDQEADQVSGRRVCAGYNVGETNVWVVAARLLYCFDFTENPVSNPTILRYNPLT